MPRSGRAVQASFSRSAQQETLSGPDQYFLRAEKSWTRRASSPRHQMGCALRTCAFTGAVTACGSSPRVSPDRLPSFAPDKSTAWPAGGRLGNVRDQDPQLLNQLEFLGRLLFPTDGITEGLAGRRDVASRASTMRCGPFGVVPELRTAHRHCVCA